MMHQTYFKSRPHILDVEESKRVKAATWRRTVAAVRVRDKGKCRSCGKHGSHPHHLIFRSHGGADVESNLVWLCARCHRYIHDRVLLVAFDPHDPQGTLTITRNPQWDEETTR